MQLLFISLLVQLGPPRLRRLAVELTPFKSVQRLKSIIDVMDTTSTQILHRKKDALEQGDEAILKQVGQGNDLLSILGTHPFLVYLVALARPSE